MIDLLFVLPMGIVGAPQIIIIVLVIIIFFGGKKIPELMRGMGRGMKEFKDAVNKDYSQEEIQDAEVIEERAALPAAKKRTSASTAKKTTAKKTTAKAKK